MVGHGSDPLDPFLNCDQVVKNVVSPLESNFRKIAKNFENCVVEVPKNGYLKTCADNSVIDFVKRKRVASTNVDHHIKLNGGEKKNANFPVKIFAGLLGRNCGNDLLHNICVCANGVENLKERYESDNGGKVDRNSNGNVLHFEMTWSVLIDGLVNFFHNPVQDRKSGIKQEKLMIKGGKGACINGFSSNLKFGRVGGVPSSIIWVPSVDDAKDEGVNIAVNQNGSEADSPQKLDQEFLGVPLSNKERLRSILSTITLTELSGLYLP